ncbi:MAG: aldehyde ferredoxin oxidoreductase family protein [Candidatus Heimdallarchaeota archaeon]
MFGYAGTILRIDLTRRKIKQVILEEEFARKWVGGRGFNSMIMYHEVSSNTDPMSPENLLMFGMGPLNGTAFPCASRFTVTAKSPLTGIFGDSNAGGHFAPEMKYAGYDQIIISGKAPKPCYIFIQDKEIQILDAVHLWGTDIWETHRVIRRDHNDQRIQVACIGPAGENGVKYAIIAANLTRVAGRAGMGTIMGGKNLKALAIRGTGTISVAAPQRFHELAENFKQQVLTHPGYERRAQLGTTQLVSALNKLGILPTRHFKEGVFEFADTVSGETLQRLYNVKQKSCFACPVHCSRYYVINEGSYIGTRGEGPEYETQCGFSSRLGNKDLQFVLHMNNFVNKMGLDSITTSEVIGFVMECYEKGILTKKDVGGLELTWGNKETIETLTTWIVTRTGFGETLAHGVRRAAELIGKGSEKYAFHTKGLELICGDPRGIKGYGLTYAIATRGGDHLRAEPFFELTNDFEMAENRWGIREIADRLEFKGKGVLVSYTEEIAALTDAMTICKNIGLCMDILNPQMAAELYTATTGLKMTVEEITRAAQRIIHIERCFNAREGIRRKDDTLPTRFLKESLQNGATAGQVVELEPMLLEYYQIRGIDPGTGIPVPVKLRELELAVPARDMESLINMT